MSDELIEEIQKAITFARERCPSSIPFEQATAAISAIHSAGYVIVPLKPTKESISAGDEQFHKLFNKSKTKYTSAEVMYETMIGIFK